MNAQIWIRKSHRYLVFFVGIQFLMWTLGGLLFSWSDMDSVHGDHLKKKKENIAFEKALCSPADAFASLKTDYKADSMRSLQLVEVLGETFYKIGFSHKTGAHAHKMLRLVSAKDCKARAPISGEEAIKIAIQASTLNYPVKECTLIGENEADAGQEFRNTEMPVYKVLFDHPEAPAFYVGIHTGQVEKVRNDLWRRFDFFWMLHTMDYSTRDNIVNPLLRLFSVLGLIAIFSGYLLFLISSPNFLRWARKTGLR